MKVPKSIKPSGDEAIYLEGYKDGTLGNHFNIHANIARLMDVGKFREIEERQARAYELGHTDGARARSLLKGGLG